MTAAEDDKRRIVNRLRRARGQLDAVITAIENDAPCRDVVTQLAAVSHALNRAGYLTVSTAMRECLSPETTVSAGGQGLTADELEKIFLTLA